MHETGDNAEHHTRPEHQSRGRGPISRGYVVMTVVVVALVAAFVLFVH